jgi:hypothetical protein
MYLNQPFSPATQLVTFWDSVGLTDYSAFADRRTAVAEWMLRNPACFADFSFATRAATVAIAILMLIRAYRGATDKAASGTAVAAV